MREIFINFLFGGKVILGADHSLLVVLIFTIIEYKII